MNAGCDLAELHLKYEEVDPWPVTINDGHGLPSNMPPGELFRVKKMRFGGARDHLDKSIIIYNDYITISDIPLEAYGYVVGGRSALEWVMDRQRVKVDKASGLVSDANMYAIETAGSYAYPLELLQRIITVSMRTIGIVKRLPRLERGDD